MNRKILFAALAAAACLACEKNENVEQYVEKDAVTLEVVVPSAVTKVTGTVNEDAVSSYQVLVYSLEDNRLEAYTKTDGASSSIVLKCTAGQKEIVVFANAPKMKSYVSLAGLKEARSKLEHNSPDALVMEGNSVVNLTSSSSVTVQLKRMVAKVRLKKITLAFESDVYAGKNFEFVSAYLINVPADKKYLGEVTAAQGAAPVEWYNKMGYLSNSIYDPILKDDINQTVSGEYVKEHVFYCYPNPYATDNYSSTWSVRPTRLIVEAKLDGVQYYYPISLPELKQNTVYDVSLIVTRPGKTDVNAEVKKYDETFDIEILDWSTGTVVEETL